MNKNHDVKEADVEWIQSLLSATNRAIGGALSVYFVKLQGKVSKIPYQRQVKTEEYTGSIKMEMRSDERIFIVEKISEERLWVNVI